MATKNVSRAETFVNVDEAQLVRLEALAGLQKADKNVLLKLYKKKDPQLAKDLKENLAFYEALRNASKICTKLTKKSQEDFLKKELGTLPYQDLLFLAKRDKEQEQLIADIIL